MESEAADVQDRILRTPVYHFDEPCPYLPGRAARLQGFVAARVPVSLYRELLDHSFRRSGRLFYAPNCVGCGECRPLRVPVASFRPSRSQRRCWKANADLTVEVDTPRLNDEKLSLYADYQRRKHGHTDEKDVGALGDFLYNPVVTSLEFCYRNAHGSLVAVGICDLFDDALSSVYCFYDPSLGRRGLGTYSALFELDYARKHQLRYYYLGYYVRDCQAMRYKASFRPCEALDVDGQWHEGPEAALPGCQGLRMDGP